jgi:hypothetical protein
MPIAGLVRRSQPVVLAESFRSWRRCSIPGPDGDGFPNEDEWLYKTDPNVKESQPEFYTLLFLNRWIKVRFRLKFQAYDGDPRRRRRWNFRSTHWMPVRGLNSLKSETLSEHKIQGHQI